MAGISKKDLKGTMLEVLEPFAKSVQRDFQKVHSRLDGVENKLRTVKSDLSEVKSEVQLVKHDLSEVKSEVQLVKHDLSEVKKDVKEMKKNASELFGKLDRFISLYEKQEQETVILGGQLKRLEDRVAQLEARIKLK